MDHVDKLAESAYTCIVRSPCKEDVIETPPNDTVRFGIVGTGWAGIRHLEAILHAGNHLSSTAVFDTDLDQAEATAARFDVDRVYSTYEELLADPQVDVVDICAPHRFHAPMAIEAARAGKHILVEKPIATTVREAREMVAVADEHDVRLGVAEHQVYDESTRVTGQLLEEGHVGEIIFSVGTWGFRAPDFSYPGRRSWLTDPTRGGTGTWMLHGIHRVAQIRSLIGEVVLVYATEHKTPSFQRRDIEGTLTALLTMASGSSVYIAQSTESPIGDSQGLSIYGEKGVIHVTDHHIRLTLSTGHDRVIDLVANPLLPYVREIEAFAAHVSVGQPCTTDGVAEMGSLAVVEAGYQSVATGKPVIPEA